MMTFEELKELLKTHPKLRHVKQVPLENTRIELHIGGWCLCVYPTSPIAGHVLIFNNGANAEFKPSDEALAFILSEVQKVVDAAHSIYMSWRYVPLSVTDNR